MKGYVLLCVLLSVVSIGVAFCNSSTYDFVICVHTGVEVKSSQKECWPNCTTVCTSFECVNDNITNSTAVLFETNQIGLNWLFSFSNLNNIALIGLCEEQTTVTCNSTDSTGAGLAFISTKNLTIANLAFRHCGALHNSTTIDYETRNHTVDFRSAIYIVNSAINIFIENIIVSFSNGNGIAFIDTNGNVMVKDSNFEQNRVEKSEYDIYSGGGGVYVEFTYCTPGIYGECDHSNQHTNNSRYTFQKCNFTDNRASTRNFQQTRFLPAMETDLQGLGRGGGLGIFFKGLASDNSIDISDCKFQSNQAVWGGGIYIRFQDATTNNNISIKYSTFENNTCGDNFGGGASIGQLIHSNDQSPQKNSIHFYNCMFIGNSAKSGGGLNIFSSQSVNEGLKNTLNIKCIICTWQENKAQYGFAVDVSPEVWDTLSNGFLPIPVFENCKFISNTATQIINAGQSSLPQFTTGRGAFMLTGFTVQFKGELYFANNTGSAVYAISSILQFAPGMNATFINNSGPDGGAVALIGFSAMYVNDDSTFTFSHNRATVRGGAIFFFSIDKHDFIPSRTCFIQYEGNCTEPKESVLFSFVENRAAAATTLLKNESLDFGHSIFATSLRPCQYACSSYPNRSLNVFDCIGNFTTDNASDPYMNNEMSTYGRHFYFKVNTSDPYFPLKAVPGKETNLSVVLEDDLQHQVHQVYQVSIQNDPDSNIILSDAYYYTSNEQVVVFGNPEDEANLTLKTIEFREVGVILKIKLEECPPGYVLHTTKQICVCSADLESSYNGIHKCNSTLFQAYIHRGYWVGYVSSETETGLLSSYCPRGFCFPENSQMHFLLPNNASKTALDDYVCGTSRTGIICGKCRTGYSVYYHSNRFHCLKNKYCKIGWLFYILSELFPLTVLFVLVVVLNISFTGGAANGFIFFAQVLDSLSINVDDFIDFPQGVWKLTKVHQFIYRFFNLEFFTITQLSFCLWDGATAIDVITFKYITVLCALLLVLATIFLMNICNCYRMCPCLRRHTVRNSIIHGFTTFLVMCYAQCARVSFYILKKAYLYSRGPTYNRTVVFYQGNIVFLSPQHLPYAIPAILSLATIVAIPPLLLLIYPAHYKIIALLRLEKSEKMQRILKWFPIEKLKPLLDSFQSCFKDNLRFFSGLYFVYRLLPLITNAVTTSATQKYTVTGIEFTAILLIHAISQPYQKRWHNILDAFIFANLAIINGLTFFNYTRAGCGNHRVQQQTDIVASVQLVLIYLPMIYMVVYALGHLLCKLYYSKGGSNSEDPTEDNELPARLMSSDEEEDHSMEYHQL